MTAETLDQAMNERRLELVPPLRWSHVARLVGMDAANLRRIRRGEIALTEIAAVGIDRALEWPKGRAWRLYYDDSSSEDSSSEVEHHAQMPDLLDDTERQIWSMDLLDEDLRWDYIRIYRKKKQQKRRSAPGESA